MLKKLEKGVVLIEVDSLDDIRGFREMRSGPELIGELQESAYHGMVYAEEQMKDGRLVRKIIHSQLGRYQEGVRSKYLEKYFSPLERKLGEVYVLRPKVSAQLNEVAKRWDPDLMMDQVEAKSRDQSSNSKSKRLPTPYGLRSFEVINDMYSPIITLFRAFRAYERNHESTVEEISQLTLKAKPLSKNKGVSCSEFVGYSHKVALIESSFPNGLPKDIVKTMNAIHSYMKDKKIKKLSQVPDELFLEFNKNVEAALTPDIYDQLCYPLKGMGISFFAENVLSREEQWEFEGYLCYMSVASDDGHQYEPHVLDHNTFRLLSTNENSEKGLHSMIVTEDELKQLSVKPTHRA